MSKYAESIGALGTLLLLAACGGKGSCPDSQEVTLAPEENSADFVTLTDVVPDAILEIRYYGTYNFVGARIDGYLQPTALLTRRAADSLRAVSDDLKAQVSCILPKGRRSEPSGEC